MGNCKNIRVSKRNTQEKDEIMRRKHTQKRQREGARKAYK